MSEDCSEDCNENLCEETAKFSREELCKLYDRAKWMSRNVENKSWRLVYLRLSETLDTLDAFLARSQMGTQP